MVSSINFISSISFGSSKVDKLTDATKKKLEALGIDTSSIKTESEGQSILAAVKKQQEQPNKASGNSQQDAIEAKVKDLASQLNLAVNSKDDVAATMDRIATAIKEIENKAIGDPKKIAEAAKYQAAYDSIVSSISNLQQQHDASQSKIAGSLDGMAFYNKIRLGLS